MVRVLSLLWTLFLAFITTAVSFFYIREETRHGFPFTFAKDVFEADGQVGYNINFFSVFLNVLVWWVLFSLVWLIVKNYILEAD